MIHSAIKYVLTIAAVLSLTSCLRTTVNLSPDEGVKRYEERYSFFIFGLLPEERKVETSVMCPDSELTKLESTTTALDGFFGAITFGIFYPKTLIGWCKS